MTTYQEKELSTHQLKAGEEIVEYMGEGIPNVRWNVLFAQPQSGKSDTFYFVGAEAWEAGDKACWASRVSRALQGTTMPFAGLTIKCMF